MGNTSEMTMLLSTPSYAPPEFKNAKKDYDARVDIWQIGLISKVYKILI